MNNLYSSIFLLFISFGCKEKVPYDDLKINMIQVLGSHNSYKQHIEPELLNLIAENVPSIAKTLDYGHVSLTKQLEKYKLRNLELDVVYDSTGGRFSYPVGLEMLQKQGIVPKPYNELKQLDDPGFKTMHIPDIDFRSHCLRLEDCLQEIKDWSDINSDHLPIAITFNLKIEGLLRPGFVKLLPFSERTLDLLEETILSVFPRERLIIPDDIRGDYETLEAAVKDHNWPLIKTSRGKFLLVLDETGETANTYKRGHPSLKGRIMFINASPGTPEAAFVIMNDPVNYQEAIKTLVQFGYMVRTRADADTEEARMGDYIRFEAALSSGAQFISTDYYIPDPRFNTDYMIVMPHGKVARRNPIIDP